jgi:hypothetical protein
MQLSPPRGRAPGGRRKTLPIPGTENDGDITKIGEHGIRERRRRTAGQEGKVAKGQKARNRPGTQRPGERRSGAKRPGGTTAEGNHGQGAQGKARARQAHHSKGERRRSAGKAHQSARRGHTEHEKRTSEGERAEKDGEAQSAKRASNAGRRRRTPEKRKKRTPRAYRLTHRNQKWGNSAQSARGGGRAPSQSANKRNEHGNRQEHAAESDRSADQQGERGTDTERAPEHELGTGNGAEGDQARWEGMHSVRAHRKARARKQKEGETPRRRRSKKLVGAAKNRRKEPDWQRAAERGRN